MNNPMKRTAMKQQKIRRGWWCGSLLGVLILSGFAWPLGAQEFRKAPDLQGVITGSVETGKLMLSAGDKIYVGLEKELSLKHGDAIAIFQVALLPEKEGQSPLFRRVGRGRLLEIIAPQLLLCIIDASEREIAVGDRVLVGFPR
jgi:hypothetical protein